MGTSIPRPRRSRVSRGFGKAPRFVWAYTWFGARMQMPVLTGELR